MTTKIHIKVARKIENKNKRPNERKNIPHKKETKRHDLQRKINVARVNLDNQLGALEQVSITMFELIHVYMRTRTSSILRRHLHGLVEQTFLGRVMTWATTSLAKNNCDYQKNRKLIPLGVLNNILIMIAKRVH